MSFQSFLKQIYLQFSLCKKSKERRDSERYTFDQRVEKRMFEMRGGGFLNYIHDPGRKKRLRRSPFYYRQQLLVFHEMQNRVMVFSRDMAIHD